MVSNILSGANALGSIDKSLQQLQAQVQESSDQIQEVSDSIAAIGQEQAAHFRELAIIRLDNQIGNQIAFDLDAANQRVNELLIKRKQSLANLNIEIQSARETQAEKEKERSKLSKQLEDATEVLDQQELKTQRRLEQQDNYRKQLEIAQKADRTARPAERKAQEAQENREEKGKPYESDPLFTYLWERGYGTSKYKANPLTRFFDKWVAGLCDYHDARPNYHMLLEIPVRLDEHAKQVRENAEKEFAALQKLEQDAAAEDGIPALEAAIEEIQQSIDEVDAQINQVEENIRTLLETRTRFSTGDDPQFREAIDTLTTVLENEDLDSLYRQARATPDARDDLLVEQLYQSDQRIQQLKQALSEHKKIHEKHLDRLTELEKVRQNFKRERFDNAHSGFGNKAMMAMILNQFLQGLTSSDNLWDTIRQQQQYRPRRANPTFGSGGMRGRKGTWQSPFSRRGGLGTGSWGGGLGRTGGRSTGGRGGFRTGGGF